MPLPDDQVVTTSEKLWSEECQIADDTPEDKTVYEWSNGRKFIKEENPYVDQPQ